MALLAIGKKKSANHDELSTLIDSVSEDQILVSDSAAMKIGHSLLRVGVVGGGCSGLSYHYAIESCPRENDFMFENGDAKIIVDPKSLKLIGGSVLVWRDEMGKKGFELLNHRNRKSCSCGKSFAL